MKFFIHSFGCRTNQADGDYIVEQLVKRGHKLVENVTSARLIIVNSCTVTHKTDHDVRKLVRHFHRINPDAKIIFTGCYAQRVPDALGSDDGVWIVAGNTEREKIAKLIDVLRSDNFYSFHSNKTSERQMDSLHVAWRNHLRPFVKVQDGCNAKCSYCIIPTVRGPSKSVPPKIVIEGIKQLLSKQSVNEIVLTGIHLGCYGLDLKQKIRLSSLVRMILNETDIARIRLSSIEPMEFDEEILGLIADEHRIAPHLHIPLQSGSPEILKAMKRPYGPDKFKSLIERVLSCRSNMAVGTDVIVGFPGESDEHFMQTFRFIEEIPFAYLHVFSFSPREGTTASCMDSRINPKKIKGRSSILHDLAIKKKIRFAELFLNTPIDALVIRAEKENQTIELLTENYIRVKTTGTYIPPNTRVEIKISFVDKKWGNVEGIIVT